VGLGNGKPVPTSDLEGAFLSIAALNPGYGRSGAGVNLLVSLWWKAEASPTLQMP
jgi:hypothetical protein